MHFSHEATRSAIRAATTLSMSSGGRFPVDLTAIARQLGVSEIATRRMASDGYLGRTRNGQLVIRVKDGSSGARRRFTIAHEIAHILLARATGRDVVDEQFRRADQTNAEETAANRVAAALLMPEPTVRRLVVGQPATWTLIASMRRTFGVSTSAMVHRLLELDGFPAVFMRAQPACSDTGSGRVDCRASICPRLLFPEPVRAYWPRIFESATNRVPLSIRAYDQERPLEIRGAARPVEAGLTLEYWFIGWE